MAPVQIVLKATELRERGSITCGVSKGLVQRLVKKHFSQLLQKITSFGFPLLSKTGSHKLNARCLLFHILQLAPRHRPGNDHLLPAEWLRPSEGTWSWALGAGGFEAPGPDFLGLRNHTQSTTQEMPGEGSRSAPRLKGRFTRFRALGLFRCPKSFWGVVSVHLPTSRAEFSHSFPVRVKPSLAAPSP